MISQLLRKSLESYLSHRYMRGTNKDYIVSLKVSKLHNTYSDLHREIYKNVDDTVVLSGKFILVEQFFVSDG